MGGTGQRSEDPAPRRVAGSAERRKWPRLELLGRLLGHSVALRADVIVLDMSRGGLSIETTFSIPPGAIHEFRLTLGDGSTAFLLARVVHCRDRASDGGPPRFQIGLEFIDDVTQRPIIDDLVNRMA